MFLDIINEILKSGVLRPHVPENPPQWRTNLMILSSCLISGWRKLGRQDPAQTDLKRARGDEPLQALNDNNVKRMEIIKKWTDDQEQNTRNNDVIISGWLSHWLPGTVKNPTSRRRAQRRTGGRVFKVQKNFSGHKQFWNLPTARHAGEERLTNQRSS